MLSLNSIISSNGTLNLTVSENLIFDSIINSDNLFKCNELIEHCIECDPEENPDLCKKCEDKYFWFKDIKACIPCNDSIYGQIGCEGKCDGSNYKKTNFTFCEKGGCKKGYYNLNGLCIKCNVNSPGCSKCTYELKENEYEGNFTCHECESIEYKLTEFGNCEHCSLPYCEKCHYTQNYTKPECDKCVKDYYINSYGKCKRCYFILINNNKGQCKVCSDNKTEYVKDSCWCDYGYELTEGPKCSMIPKNCRVYLYNTTINDLICLRCSENYTTNENKTKCIYCGDECKYCIYNEKDNKTECISCISGLSIFNGKCVDSIEGCTQHILNKSSEYKNQSLCKKCDSSYALNPENKCTSCLYNNPDAGYGCNKCYFNTVSEKYKCLKCQNNYYTYIVNKLQCLRIGEKEKYLYGCNKMF